MTGRRNFLRVLGSSVGSLTAALATGGCSKTLVCTDISALSAEEQNQRSTLKYADASPDPAKKCDNCLQFKPAAPDQCGACGALKGPVHPQGHCTAWAVKS